MKQDRKFTAAEFSDGAWADAKGRAAYANKLVRFVRSGFKPTLWNKPLYNLLSNSFGHIAHFNMHGFYETWFANDVSRLKWLRYVAGGGFLGGFYSNPKFTLVDVERAIAAWVRQSGLIEEYQAKIADAVETRERAALAQLKAKYEATA